MFVVGMMNETVFLLLGTNLGDRRENLRAAETSLVAGDVTIVRRSHVYETAAWGKEDQPAFFNQVLKATTTLDPTSLLQFALSIEERLGRTRKEKWGARSIDIDVLFYGNQVVNTTTLTIPHPRLHVRRFTLIPLNEIAPTLMHPVLHQTVHELLLQCTDPLDVQQVGV